MPTEQYDLRAVIHHDYGKDLTILKAVDEITADEGNKFKVCSVSVSTATSRLPRQSRYGADKTGSMIFEPGLKAAERGFDNFLLPAHIGALGFLMRQLHRVHSKHGLVLTMWRGI
ncbi:hypothetical protein KIN20_019600 [Parelaphostrongylus tenuis]|uniref:Uncharacterized protein n=1 Tax=Parelaphostrongylus tenuis TaxID=148309 RepID=A0AAD5QSJ1_PARTN|nr:hypothetical protein KIN20_019600 [Parelaphostrongylus tenuis]